MVAAKPGGGLFLWAALSTMAALSLSSCKCSSKAEPMDDGEFWTSGYKVLMGGDFGFGDSYSEGREALEKYGYDHPLEKLSTFFEAADYSIINLETPVADLDITPYVQNKKWVHLGEVSVYSKYLKKYGVDAVGLANNHLKDCGPEGLLQTLKTMDAIGVDRFGAGANLDEAARPLVKSFKIGKTNIELVVLAAYEYKEDKNSSEYKSRFATGDSPGVNPLSFERIENLIDKQKKDGARSFVVAFPHWGSNYKWKSGGQKKAAKKLIESGADIVIGHGAHLMQEIEKYKDKWIVYSLGNFMFNTKGRYQKKKKWPYSMTAILRFSASGSKLKIRMRLYPTVSDNLRTKFQSRPVNEKEFDEVINLLIERSKDDYPSDLTTGKDKLGYYLEGVVRP